MQGYGMYSAMPRDLVLRLYKWIKEVIFCAVLWMLSAGPVPKHVAIIMDGNRRYADKRHMEKKSEGHESGAESLANSLRHFYDLGVKYVSVYAFSVENFNRSAEEVEALMDMMIRRFESIVDNTTVAGVLGVRVRIVGNIDLLPDRVRRAADQAIQATADNDCAVLNLCIAYSSSNEISNAVSKCCIESFQKEFKLENGVDEIERNLYTVGCPEPDLLIRTSGETRLSNFMLWQSGFCYLHVCKALWPEFSFWHISWAVICYQRVFASVQRARDLYERISCRQ